MRDPHPAPGEKTQYECFGCGRIIVAEDNPNRCPECGGPVRNRRMPLE